MAASMAVGIALILVSVLVKPSPKSHAGAAVHAGAAGHHSSAGQSSQTRAKSLYTGPLVVKSGSQRLGVSGSNPSMETGKLGAAGFVLGGAAKTVFTWTGRQGFYSQVPSVPAFDAKMKKTLAFIESMNAGADRKLQVVDSGYLQATLKDGTLATLSGMKPLEGSTATTMPAGSATEFYNFSKNVALIRTVDTKTMDASTGMYVALIYPSGSGFALLQKPLSGSGPLVWGGVHTPSGGRLWAPGLGTIQVTISSA